MVWRLLELLLAISEFILLWPATKQLNQRKLGVLNPRSYCQGLRRTNEKDLSYMKVEPIPFVIAHIAHIKWYTSTIKHIWKYLQYARRYKNTGPILFCFCCDLKPVDLNHTLKNCFTSTVSMMGLSYIPWHSPSWCKYITWIQRNW